MVTCTDLAVDYNVAQLLVAAASVAPWERRGGGVVRSRSELALPA